MYHLSLGAVPSLEPPYFAEQNRSGQVEMAMNELSMTNSSVNISVRDRISELLEKLTDGLYEREEPMRLALLSTIAGESIFLLGPPGVGKSLIARRLKFAFKDGTSFEYLMSKFSTPDEVFGPVSIKKLKEEDKYERLTDKYLPGANIVFLDEIWKSGPAIQNSLLTILNEKIYRNGEQETKVNIRGIITASNELPPGKESFLPLWDRLLIRYSLDGIKKNRNFIQMITDTRDLYEDPVPERLKMNEAELLVWDEQIDQVELPSEVLNTIQVIRYKIEALNEDPQKEIADFQLFDRRWKKLVRLLRTSAFLNGRTKVDLMDCFLAVHCLWGHPNQLEVVQEVIGESIRKHGYSISINLNMLRKEISAFEQEVDKETRIKYSTVEDRLQPIQEEYYSFVAEEKPFQGELIKIEDFNNLKLEDWQVINIYDKNLNLRHRLKSKRSSQPHSIDIIYNSLETQYPLTTTKVERMETIMKKPHKLVEKHWNEQAEQIGQYLKTQQQRLNKETPEELAHLQHNLFIEKRLATIVEANWQEVKEALEQLRLRLEKAVHAYSHLI